jgi:hypothetical protein
MGVYGRPLDYIYVFFPSLPLFSRGIRSGSGIKPDAPPIIRDISYVFHISYFIFHISFFIFLFHVFLVYRFHVDFHVVC